MEIVCRKGGGGERVWREGVERVCISVENEKKIGYKKGYKIVLRSALGGCISEWEYSQECGDDKPRG